LFYHGVPVFFQICTQGLAIDTQNAAPYHDNHVSGGQAMLIFSKALSESPFQTVSMDRFGNLLFRYGKSQSWAMSGLNSNQNGNTTVDQAKVILKYLPVILRMR